MWGCIFFFPLAERYENVSIFCQGGYLLIISQLKLVINHSQPFLFPMPLYSQPSFNSIILKIFTSSKPLKCWDSASSSKFPSTSIPVRFTTSDILINAWYFIAGGYHQWWGSHCHLAGDPAPKSCFGFCFLRLFLAPRFISGLPGNNSEFNVYWVVFWGTTPICRQGGQRGKLNCDAVTTKFQLTHGALKLECSSKTSHNEAGVSRICMTTSTFPWSKAAPFIQGPFVMSVLPWAISRQHVCPLGEWVPQSSWEELEGTSQHPL